jgi:hypothetical protein
LFFLLETVGENGDVETIDEESATHTNKQRGEEKDRGKDKDGTKKDDGEKS